MILPPLAFPAVRIETKNNKITGSFLGPGKHFKKPVPSTIKKYTSDKLACLSLLYEFDN